VDICLIQVPYTMGAERQDTSKGSERLVQAGATKLVTSKGVAVTVERVDRCEPFRDSGNASLAVCKRLALIVRQAIRPNSFLWYWPEAAMSAGAYSRASTMGSAVSFGSMRMAISIPETTTSGYFDGMSLAVITGHSYRNYWAQIGNSTPIPESATLSLGVRDLDPAEREHLFHSAIQVVMWHEGKPQGDVRAALDKLAQRAPEVYLHIDMDSLNPHVAPGVVFDPVPGGISLEDMEESIRAVFARFRVRAATLAVYDPDREQNDKTLRAGLRIIEVLADSARAQEH
jgi:arginase